MGAWGYKAWDSEAAADWFRSAFDGADLDTRIEEAVSCTDNYDEVRAAAYLLTVLGHSPYVWPGDLGRLDEFARRVHDRLAAMVDPTSDAGREVRGLWGADSPVIAQITSELAALQSAHPSLRD